jgi:hypothetical protein
LGRARASSSKGYASRKLTGTQAHNLLLDLSTRKKRNEAAAAQYSREMKTPKHQTAGTKKETGNNSTY